MQYSLLPKQIPSWLTQFMRELLTQDGYRGADALKNRGSKGSPDGQAINEVVQAIAQCDHPGQCANIIVGCPFYPVAATSRGAGSLCTIWSLGVLAKPESNTQTINYQECNSTSQKRAFAVNSSEADDIESLPVISVQDWTWAHPRLRPPCPKPDWWLLRFAAASPFPLPPQHGSTLSNSLHWDNHHDCGPEVKKHIYDYIILIIGFFISCVLIFQTIIIYIFLLIHVTKCNTWYELTPCFCLRSTLRIFSVKKKR